MSDDLNILIDEDGEIAFVYDDALAEVFEGEPQETTRASHVEPASQYFDSFAGRLVHGSVGPLGAPVGGWVADMRPSGGPVLLEGGTWPNGAPFKTRQAALDAERAWLRKEMGL